MTEVSYQKFISERADPRLIIKLKKAKEEGDEKIIKELKAELMRKCQEFNKVYCQQYKGVGEIEKYSFI